jgi:adenylate cyclase
VTGNAVNVAARMAAMCRHVQYDILVPTDVAEAAGDLAVLDARVLALKGKSDRARASIVVGDAAVAGTEGFRALADRHAALLPTLGRTGPAVSAAIRACRALAIAVKPGLGAFYDRLVCRRADLAVPAGDRDPAGSRA